MGAPQYKEPQLDPVFGQLLAQSQRQGIEATQQDIGAQAGRLAARFGVANYGMGSAGGPAAPFASSPTSADPAALLARYSMQLAGGRGFAGVA